MNTLKAIAVQAMAFYTFTKKIMMGRKWMVFQLANILIIALSLAMIAAVIFQRFNSAVNSPEPDTSGAIYLVILIGFALMLTFSLLCTYVLRSKFPDKYISPKFSAAFKIIGVLAVIFAAFFLLGMIAITPGVLEKLSNPSESRTELYILIGFVTYIIIFTYAFIVGQKMIRSVNHAFLSNEQASIDALGNITP